MVIVGIITALLFVYLLYALFNPESAKLQIPAVSKATGISAEKLQKIVDNNTEGKSLGIFGEKRVNVLMVNLEVAKLLKDSGKL